MKPITKLEEFNEYILSEQPIVIKFFTDWCPDCRRMDVFVSDIMKDFSSVQWFTINKDQFPDVASQYDVMGIPSLLVFQKGQKLAHLHSANAKTPDQVREFLQEALD